MKHITISADTLREIKDFFEGFNGFDDCDIYDGDYQSVDVEDAEFQQDGCDIIVGGDVTARLEKGHRSYNRDVPDDPAYFYNGGFEITSADAYDKDSDNVVIDNIDDLLNLNEFSVIK